MSVPQAALRTPTLDLHAWPTPLRCADLWWQRGGTPVPKGRPRFVMTRAGHVRAVTPEATRAANLCEPGCLHGGEACNES